MKPLSGLSLRVWSSVTRKLGLGSLQALLRLGAWSGLPSFSAVRRCHLFRSPFSDNPPLKQRKNDPFAVFIEYADDVRDGVCVVDEEFTDRHCPFALVIKVAGIWRQGEFAFPDMETVSILSYGLSHRKFLLSREEHAGNSSLSGGVTENTLSYRHYGGNPYAGGFLHRDSCGSIRVIDRQNSGLEVGKIRVMDWQNSGHDDSNFA